MPGGPLRFSRGLPRTAVSADLSASGEPPAALHLGELAEGATHGQAARDVPRPANDRGSILGDGEQRLHRGLAPAELIVRPRRRLGPVAALDHAAPALREGLAGPAQRPHAKGEVVAVSAPGRLDAREPGRDQVFPARLDAQPAGGERVGRPRSKEERRIGQVRPILRRDRRDRQDLTREHVAGDAETYELVAVVISRGPLERQSDLAGRVHGEIGEELVASGGNGPDLVAVGVTHQTPRRALQSIDRHLERAKARTGEADFQPAESPPRCDLVRLRTGPHELGHGRWSVRVRAAAQRGEDDTHSQRGSGVHKTSVGAALHSERFTTAQPRVCYWRALERMLPLTDFSRPEGASAKAVAPPARGFIASWDRAEAAQA